MDNQTIKPLTKTQTLTTLAERSGLTKQQIATVIEALGDTIVENLKEGSPGVFTLPGLMKIKVQRKPAQPERQGINPFTGEETTFKAKPAKNMVKIAPLKALKDRV